MRFLKMTIIILGYSGLLPAAIAHADVCSDRNGVHLQVLGSGGPVADDGRASSAYLIWVDAQSRVLVDAGGGAFLRFGEAGASFTDLDIVAISHFHTDHSADFVTLLKTGFFSARERALAVAGPDAGGPFPALDAWLESNLGPGEAYGYLGGYLNGSGGLVQLLTTTVDAERRDAVVVFENTDQKIRVLGTGVPHGIVPTIAYRVSVDDHDIVFSSDQNGNDDAFIEFARNADVLVMHMVVPEDAAGAMRALHAPPSRIGEIAEAAGARRLLVSHFMARSLAMRSENIERIRRQFGGEIIAAEDLLCLPLD